jgi:hypothetical protein
MLFSHSGFNLLEIMLDIVKRSARGYVGIFNGIYGLLKRLFVQADSHRKSLAKFP